MKLTILFLVSFIFIVDANTCNTTQSFELVKLSPTFSKIVKKCDPFIKTDEANVNLIRHEKKLSPYWAQKAIGLYELRRFFESNGSPSKVYTGIVDSDLSVKNFPDDYLVIKKKFSPEIVSKSHGAKVLNLMNAPFPIGVAHNGVVGGLSRKSEMSELYFKSSWNPFSKEFPGVVVQSMYPRGGSISGAIGFRKFHDKVSQKSTIVVSIGNDFPRMPSKVFSGSDAIFVGNINADGLMHPTSQEDSNITISAPAGKVIDTIDEQGKISQFGGTSAAAPMVAGTIAMIKGYLKDVSNKEIRELLKNTAIQTSGFLSDKGRNGAGSLNAYAAVRVAQLLSKGWPKNRKKIFTSEVYNSLKNDALGPATQAFKMLESPNITCSDLKIATRKLRQAFFKNPELKRVRMILANLYEELGYISESHFYGKTLPEHPEQDPALRAFLSSLVHGDLEGIKLGVKQGYSLNQKYGTGSSSYLSPLDYLIGTHNHNAINYLLNVDESLVTDKTKFLAVFSVENGSSAKEILETLSIILKNSPKQFDSGTELIKKLELLKKVHKSVPPLHREIETLIRGIKALKL